jgi:hypothetical protein
LLFHIMYHLYRMHRTNCFADFENNKTHGVLNQARQSGQWYVTPFGMASNKKPNKISTQSLKLCLSISCIKISALYRICET